MHRLTGFRFYNAHETTAVEEFSIAVLCGDVRCDVSQLSLQMEHLADVFLDVRRCPHPRWQ